MAKAQEQPDLLLVELNSEVRVRTPLPPSCHSALRAGFAGYSTNPRWNKAKLEAWRLGRKWREALASGEMQVYGPELLLMTRQERQANSAESLGTEEATTKQNSEGSDSNRLNALLSWSRKRFVAG